MRFTVLESDQSSSSADSFHSSEEKTIQDTSTVDNQLIKMVEFSNPQSGDVDMMTDRPRDERANLSVEELQELVRLLVGKNTEVNQASSTVNRQDASLTKWDGDQKEFPFYMQLLEARIEEEWDGKISDKSICLDMVNSLPVNKRPRVAGWFNERAEDNKYNWRQLAQHFRNQFEDKQARLAASEKLLRMEQNDQQFFGDFIKDFEYQVAISGGNRTWTPVSKVNILNAAINDSLRKALVPVKLPPEDEYSLWVTEVKEVADKLEALPDYRPKGATRISTRLGPPKSGNALSKDKEPARDLDGDIVMKDVDSILSVLSNLLKDRNTESLASVNPKSKSRTNQENRHSESSPVKRPPAPWRSKKDFERLIEKNLCVRCTRPGHIGKDCRKFSRAKRPKSNLNASDMIEEEEEEETPDSGNEEP